MFIVIFNDINHDFIAIGQSATYTDNNKELSITFQMMKTNILRSWHILWCFVLIFVAFVMIKLGFLNSSRTLGNIWIEISVLLEFHIYFTLFEWVLFYQIWIVLVFSVLKSLNIIYLRATRSFKSKNLRLCPDIRF